MYELVISFFFFKQNTAYEMRISDWSSDVCSSDLKRRHVHFHHRRAIVLAACHCHWCVLLSLLPTDQIPGSTGLEMKPTVGYPAEIGRASCRERGCQYV